MSPKAWFLVKVEDGKVVVASDLFVSFNLALQYYIARPDRHEMKICETCYGSADLISKLINSSAE